jgi:hypothetical protein
MVPLAELQNVYGRLFNAPMCIINSVRAMNPKKPDSFGPRTFDFF